MLCICKGHSRRLIAFIPFSLSLLTKQFPHFCNPLHFYHWPSWTNLVELKSWLTGSACTRILFNWWTFVSLRILVNVAHVARADCFRITVVSPRIKCQLHVPIVTNAAPMLLLAYAIVSLNVKCCYHFNFNCLDIIFAIFRYLHI